MTVDQVRVMLVDDSAVIRGLITRALQVDERIHITATAGNGQVAVEMLRRHPVDVIVLDLEMPVRDGMSALPELKQIAPQTHIIIASGLSQRNAAISLQAIQMGASDYVPKPATGNKEALPEFYRELTAKILSLGQAKHMRPAPISRKPVAVSVSSAAARPHFSYMRRPRTMMQQVHALAIASSTGGPQALIRLLKNAAPAVRLVPCFITQHMPRSFTSILAEHISKDTGLQCSEAVHGETVSAGRVYLAPGDYHMLARRSEQGTVVIELNQNPPVNYCRPAADPMFSSLAEVYGRHLLAAVLTGMGSDGLVGARDIVAKQGVLIAQDQETSVVWGMPGAVANANLCEAVLPLDEIADYLLNTLKGGGA